MSYYLGIDGGGTKTTCAVGDESQLLATATAGPSNIVRVGEMQARESLHQAVRQACAAAGITSSDISCTCLGGAGAARPEIAATARRFLAEIIPTPIEVVGDLQIALEAAFGPGPGVVVNAGTGSFAFGRDAAGKTLRAGGWGFAIGDEGSAHWIGRDAIRAVLRAADRLGPAQVESTDTARALLQIWDVKSITDLALAANAIPPPDFAQLFPAVSAGKDSLAVSVLASAGLELAKLAAVVIDRLSAADTRIVPVAMTGGVFRHAPLVRETFYNELRKLEPRTEIRSQLVEPVDGALQIARRSKTG